MTPLRRLLLVLLLAAAAVAGDAQPARAQEQPPAPATLPQRQANFAWDKTMLRASFSFRDVVDAPIAQKLPDGLPHVLAMRAYVWLDGAATPTDLVGRSCRIVYDLWDEVYRIEITDRAGMRNTAAINIDGVLRQCAEARDFPILDRSALTAGSKYFLAVIVDVDPVSPQMLGQLRAWVTRPTGSTGISPGNAIFGSFAALFVRNIGASLKTLQFKTQFFTP